MQPGAFLEHVQPGALRVRTAWGWSWPLASPISASRRARTWHTKWKRFIACRTVAAVQVPELDRCHHDRETDVEQGIHDRAVAAFDRDLADTALVQPPTQLAQAGCAVHQ